MGRRDVIVVGASAGGIEALLAMVRELPADLPASITVVQHISPNHHSVLPQMLADAGKLPAQLARDGEKLRLGHIYVAPPDRHVLIDGNHLRLSRGPHENSSRPAVDPLFRSAAQSLGPRVIGVILSGALDDGTAGLHAIKRRGGVAVVQDPAEAIYSDMPRNAMQAVPVDYVMPVAKIARLLPKLVQEQVRNGRSRHPNAVLGELAVGLPGHHAPSVKDDPSPYSCPSCVGVLMELHEGGVLHFRCQVGHAYGVDALRVEQEASLEAALWAALRALEEKALLARRLAVRAREARQVKTAERFEERALAAEHQARRVRDVLQQQDFEAVERTQREARRRPGRAKSRGRGTRA